MNGERILIACIGNIFFGDDAFGVEVARRLAERPLPDGVRVVDFGIRGFDLAYALMEEEREASILVDAVRRGGPPGTLYVIEPDPSGLEQLGSDAIDTHGMTPAKVLRLVEALGGRPRGLLVVGCEAGELIGEEDLDGSDVDEDWQTGLSEPVEAAVGEAVTLIESLVSEILTGRRRGDLVPAADRGALREGGSST